MKIVSIVILVTLLPIVTFAQSDIDKILKGGELLLGGLTIMKTANSNPKNDDKAIYDVCVKNKLNDKILVKIIGKDTEEKEFKKELVIPKDGKECLLELPKGIYSYEIVLSNKEIYKKGEYMFNTDLTMVIKEE